MPGRQVNPNDARNAYNGMEKNPEISSGSYTTEYRQLDSRIGRWWSTDPVTKPSWTSYNSMSNNPIIMIDPKGAADFYNQYGQKIGTDGIKDGKLYILTTDRDIKKSRQNYFGKGIKGFFNTLIGKGKGTIQLSEFSDDVVALPSAYIRDEIGKAVDASNKPTQDDTKGGFHEEGGVFGLTADGSEKVVHAEPGAVSDPLTQGNAEINVFKAAKKEERGLIKDIQGTFHVHPSGTKQSIMNTDGSYTVGEFEQPPSEPDVNYAKQGGNKSGYNIVVGAGSGKVYVYGSKDQNRSDTNHRYRAEFPLNKFRKIGNENKSK